MHSSFIGSHEQSWISSASAAGLSCYFKAGEQLFVNFLEIQIPLLGLHVIKAVNEALNKVRSRESKENPELKGTRWALLKREENLTEKEKAKLERIPLSKKRLQTGKAYRLKLLLQELLDRGSTLTPSDARGQLKGWCRWALTCRIPEKPY